MANAWDVATRLAEGQSAVDDVQDYVTACQRLGYQHPDLTARGTQVREWYASEDGMDLQALDADCSVLSVMAAAAEDAARTQTGLVAELAGAWSGRGAAAAREFTWGSSQAANTVSDGIHVAADAAATLRDELWRAVDAKVAAVEAIDGRHRAQRAEWLAAATTVTSGAGDLAAASELVDQQVKPFVHQDIGSDWLAAMRAAASAISSAYDDALARIAAAPRGVFDVPGELGPRAEPFEPKTEGTGPAPSAVHTIPAAAVGSAPASAAPAVMSAPPTQPAAPWPDTAPAALPPPADPAMQAPTPMPAAGSPMPSLGDAGAGTSSLGTGLSGFGQQLADLIGGLLGSADGEPPDAADITQPEDIGPDDPEDSDDELDDPDADDPDADDPDADDPDADDPVAGEEGTSDAAAPGEPAVTEPSEPLPAPTPPPPPPPESPPESLPVPPAVPEAAIEVTGPTPCEIAADELPQVGE